MTNNHQMRKYINTLNEYGSDYDIDGFRIDDDDGDAYREDYGPLSDLEDFYMLDGFGHGASPDSEEGIYRQKFLNKYTTDSKFKATVDSKWKGAYPKERADAAYDMGVDINIFPVDDNADNHNAMMKTYNMLTAPDINVSEDCGYPHDEDSKTEFVNALMDRYLDDEEFRNQFNELWLNASEEERDMAVRMFGINPDKEAGPVEEEVNEGSGDKEAYQKFFNLMLTKFGVESPEELEDDKKKEFFDAVDAGWDAEDEKPEDDAVKENTMRDFINTVDEGYKGKKKCKKCKKKPCTCKKSKKSKKTNEDLLCKKCEKQPCACESTGDISESVATMDSNLLLEIWQSAIKGIIKKGTGHKPPFGMPKIKAPEAVTNRNELTRLSREYKEAYRLGDQKLIDAYASAKNAAGRKSMADAAVRQKSKDRQAHEILVARANRAHLEYQDAVKIADDLNPRMAPSKSNIDDYLDPDAFKDFKL
jgi:hypothetical protein